MPILNPNSTNYSHTWEPNLADLHLTMDYNAGGQPVLRTNNFMLDVARGAVPGHSIVFISGRNRLVPTNTEASIWTVGGLYPWSTFTNTGAAIYMTSASGATDSGVQIYIEGLDYNYNKISYVVTLNGTGTGNTDGVSFYRINAAFVVGSKALAGTVTFYYGSAVGTVVGQILAGSNRLSQSIYTVPAGYTAFSTWGDFGVLGNNSAELRAYWRFFGGVFLRIYATPITGATYAAAPPYPGAIPEKTDIDNRVAEGTNNLTASSNQQILLIENTYL